jgi:GntR family transcriptional regulator/MocR family aminotransferase
MEETSQPLEVLLSVSRGGGRTLGSQIETQLRDAIRDGRLRAGARVPSTRDLATQLGVARRVVVGAYEQLAAQGYLTLRRGARTCVAQSARTRIPSPPQPSAPAATPRFDLRPRAPDVSGFPRTEWLRCLRDAMQTMSNADLGYGDPAGAEPLRSALSEYLGRVRGVAAEPDRVVVTNGYSQAQGLICRTLLARGARRIGFENPSHPEQRRIAERAGLTVVPVAVDDAGIRLDELDRAAVDALVLTPAHQHPTGAVLTGERRRGLLAWLRRRDAIVLEDDYDAEYRYDRAAVGALQGLDPDRIVYAGSASKTLAPALRLGWLVVPPSMLAAVTDEKDLADCGTAQIEQHAFAGFLARGELDRHLRRMRTRYRRRRDLLLDELARALPEATVRGVAAGLHATVELPDGYDEQAILGQARRRGIDLTTMREFWIPPTGGRPTLLLGYAQLPIPAIPAAVRSLAEAVHRSGTASAPVPRSPGSRA